MIESQARGRARVGWTPVVDLRPAVPDPRVVHWAPVDHQSATDPWPVRQPADPPPPRPWNIAAILSPLLALLCAPVGLCVGLVAAGQIGLGRQRGIGFAVAGIVIGSLVPVVVCVWGALG